jgi:hypothetical protein
VSRFGGTVASVRGTVRGDGGNGSSDGGTASKLRAMPSGSRGNDRRDGAADSVNRADGATGRGFVPYSRETARATGFQCPAGRRKPLATPPARSRLPPSFGISKRSSGIPAARTAASAAAQDLPDPGGGRAGEALITPALFSASPPTAGEEGEVCRSWSEDVGVQTDDHLPWMIASMENLLDVRFPVCGILRFQTCQSVSRNGSDLD